VRPRVVLEREIWPLIEAGKIRPAIHTTFALGQAAQAHALMASSQHIDRIVPAVDQNA